tara:strand:- start:50 stop:208 length:159 start_codon:yes stop_codon:yes gene_type:complete
MAISKERLIDELSHYMVEVRELRSERTRLEIELSKTKAELEKVKGLYKRSFH